VTNFQMHYFSNKFSKIGKRWGLSAPSAHFYDLKLRDLPKFVVYQTDYDEIELKNISYDIISVTSSLIRYLKTSPK